MKLFNFPILVALAMIFGLTTASLSAKEQAKKPNKQREIRKGKKNQVKAKKDFPQKLVGLLSGSRAASLPKLGNGYGAALDYDGEHLVIASPNAQPFGTPNAGALYFYKKDEQGKYQEMQPFYTENVADDLLGVFSSVHLDEDFLMVSAGCSQGELSGSAAHPGGAVLFFKLINGVWTLKQRLVPNPTDLAPGDNFGGRHLFFNKKWAFIGATAQASTEPNSQKAGGSVYVYQYNETSELWEQTQKLTHPNGYSVSNVKFGAAAFIHGDYAMVAAENNFFPGVGNNGSVYCYHLVNGQWQLTQTLAGNQQLGLYPYGDRFGHAIFFNDNWAAISAVTDSTGKSILSGAVYLFKAKEIDGLKFWDSEHALKLYSDAPTVCGAFGTHLAISSQTLFVSEMRPNEQGAHVGAVLGYKKLKGSWEATPSITINNPRKQPFDYFGTDFAVSGSSIAIGTLPNFDYYTPTETPERDFSDPTVSASDGQVLIYKWKS